MKLRCRTAGGLQQLRYQVPYDIISSVVYPLLSPNGSSIVICGHSTGLFIVWRGGRRLKPAKKVPDPTPAQDVMTIDDSDDEQNGSRVLPPPDFEEEEEEFDPRNPYPSIVQTLDLPFGTGVSQLSIPPLSQAEKGHLRPKFLRENILVAAGCTDGAIRALTLPLSPPSDISKLRKSLIEKPELAMAGQGTWGEQLVTLTKGHRTLPTAVSIAVGPKELAVERDEEDMDDAEESETAWTVLVASGSADAGGTMLVHRILVDKDESGLAAAEIEDWRNVLLGSVPTALDIYVGADVASKLYPSVIVAEATSAIRIYQCTSEQYRDFGRWTASLQHSPKSTARTLSVKYGLGGGIALALTSDGEWGVWDLSHLTEQATPEGVAKVERFSYTGTLVTSPLASAGQDGSIRKAQFNTMPAVTPHTRKVRQQALFDTSSSRPTQLLPAATSNLSGGITLVKTSHESGKGEDSSALLWCNNNGIFIQSLRAHHRGRIASQRSDPSSALTTNEDIFSSRSGIAAQLKHLTVPDRQYLNGGAQISVWPCLGATERTPSVRSKAPEAVYVSERAITFVGPPRTGDSEQRGHRNGIETSQSAGERASVGRSSLLKRGELSLAAIDGLLDSMPNPVKRLSGRA